MCHVRACATSVPAEGPLYRLDVARHVNCPSRVQRLCTRRSGTFTGVACFVASGNKTLALDPCLRTRNGSDAELSPEPAVVERESMPNGNECIRRCCTRVPDQKVPDKIINGAPPYFCCHYSFTIKKARNILDSGQDFINTFLRHGRYQLCHLGGHLGGHPFSLKARAPKK